jgi:hypothetical protein
MYNNGNTSKGIANIGVSGDNNTFDGNIIMTSGKGVDFSDNPNAGGMFSELLDDYEEGSWSPLMYGSTTAGTYNVLTAAGNYVKVGRMVQINGVIRANSGTGTGDIRISGLPFASLNTAVNSGPHVGIIQANGGLIYPTDGADACLVLFENDNILQVRVNKTDGTYAQMPYPTAPDWIRFSISYMSQL